MKEKEEEGKQQQGSSRRDFLKTCFAGSVAGSLVFGAGKQWGLAEKTLAGGRSRVVMATDAGLGTAGSGVDSRRMLALLDRALGAYFETHQPLEAWKQLVRPGQRVGLKVNTLAGPGLSTNVTLVEAILERLQQAGIRDIVVWDRSGRELQHAGFHFASGANQVRCLGTDAHGVGYEDKPESFGTVSCRVSKLMTQACDVVISVPILKHHSMSGVTFSMKNMYGVIHNPRDCHANNCNPGVADVNMLPSIRGKVRFTIGDATTCCYEGGPGFRPEYTWQQNSLVVGKDPVAVDYTGWQIVDRKRVEKGLKTLEASGKAPGYIAAAADEHHRLGVNDPKRIALVQA